MTLRTVDADVLVIGGGGMAGRAAIEASRLGARVAMLMKGTFGKSGASAFKVAEAAGYNVADGLVDAADNPEEHYKDILAAAAGTCDERLARIVAEEAPASLRELERLGVPFHMDGNRYLEVTGCFATRPRMHIIPGHAEPIVAAQRKEILSLGLPVFEHTMVTSLLVQDGACAGAVGLDGHGDLVLFRAGATVLGTGGAGQLFLLNLNPADITGDGYALGYRAGADLVNMEFMQAGLGIVHPVRNILNAWVWALRPRLSNAQHEEFLGRYLPPGIGAEGCMDARSGHYPFSTYDGSQFIDIAIQKELRVGRGTPRTGVYLDFTTTREADIPDTPRGRDARRMWGITREWIKVNRGVDIAEQPIQVACFGHAINGGLQIDPCAESTLPCLFAGGESAGGPHGADRLGGNMILTCQVFGKRAGQSAAQRARERGVPSVSPEAVAAEEERLARVQSRRGPLQPARLKRRLQEAMWRHVLVVRSEESLRACLSEVERLRDQTKDLGVEGPAHLPGALEVENLLTVAEIMARAALLRTESRGSHYREDHPRRDDGRWQTSIVTRRVNGRMEQLPLRLPRLAPSSSP
ncbi:MAG: FAD-binding protein [candidate division NC10 bacterium]|nr:FAD-binding protein [candidate division NC10 bacterium]MBI2456649.1 FAD-binding protein [candidate division NC10 bacterium]